MKLLSAITLIFIGFMLSPAQTAATGDMVFIEYEVDSCFADDIGLKKLTIEDVEDML